MFLKLNSLLICFLGFTFVAKHVLCFGQSDGLTAARKLYGFSGNYGLGANLGGITLSDIGYDLSDSFIRACSQVGINLDLIIEPTTSYGASYSPIVSTLSDDDFGRGHELHSIRESKPIDSEFVATYDSSGAEPSHELLTSDTTGAHIPDSNAKLSSIPSYLSSGADIFSSTGLGYSLTGLPITSSVYKHTENGKTSGYSAHIIHSDKSHKPSGESSVYFTQLHTQPSKLVSTPQIHHQSVVGSYDDFNPFSYESPQSYESVLNTKYSPQLTGGYGSILTGSYGSVLTNGYRRVGLLSDGGLKGLQFSFVKK